MKDKHEFSASGGQPTLSFPQESDLLTLLQEELSCPVCCSLNRLVVLECGHSICERCAAQMLGPWKRDPDDWIRLLRNATVVRRSIEQQQLQTRVSPPDVVGFEAAQVDATLASAIIDEALGYGVVCPLCRHFTLADARALRDGGAPFPMNCVAA
eukprot:CAMPEP_0175920944 /NCGR_PEP_ID=MMETSP0108-20121206/13198_1 /TAXON_ID=195067 ORGANISM="Goniomonas pacifica, Strain CCMP1869" /NCGR_SAMPLE_ID=MMETSP0108 /ASSEMBLY_ACC=CAM_ASM_000204 /LENGTH=154 /DNA_ID=CAMNT_0017243693 /DNA_START=39 /DNA_END=500 /DNA_ORIENTATION=+